MAKFLFDPGHGGDKPGAVYAGIEEKDINLEVCLTAGKLLRDQGHDVLFTRERDENVPLFQRKEMINRYRPDAFISIHCNASEKHASNGVEAFYRDDLDYPLANIIQKALAQMTGLKDRGVFQDIGDLKKRLAVLDDSEQTPACLVEIGFIDNEKDRTFIIENKNTIAVIIADAAHGWAVERGIA